MKRQCIYLLTAIALVFLLARAASPKEAINKPAKAVKLEVLNPTGAIKVKQLNAPRLDTLAGKTICTPWGSGLFRGDEVMPMLGELLQKRFPTAKVIPYTQLPIGMQQPDPIKLGTIMKEKGCDAVISGPGG